MEVTILPQPKPADFKPTERRSIRLNRHRVEVLQRRRDHLLERVQNGKSPNNWDKHEAAALAFAVEIVKDWMAADPLIDVVWWGSEWLEAAEMSDLTDRLGCEVITPSFALTSDGRPVPMPKRAELQGVREHVDRLTPAGRLSKAVRLTLLPLSTAQDPQRHRGQWGWILDLATGQLEVIG